MNLFHIYFRLLVFLSHQMTQKSRKRQSLIQSEIDCGGLLRKKVHHLLRIESDPELKNKLDTPVSAGVEYILAECNISSAVYINDRKSMAINTMSCCNCLFLSLVITLNHFLITFSHLGQCVDDVTIGTLNASRYRFTP